MSIKTGPDCDHTNCKNGMELFITLMLQDSHWLLGLTTFIPNIMGQLIRVWYLLLTGYA